jgi:hypothetical protein
MNRNEVILQELKELSNTVAQIETRQTYQVPTDYFEQLPASIWLKINKETGKPAMPQQVPAGYFDGLAANIMSRIKAEQKELTVAQELAELSPTLAAIDKNMPYQTPVGYFENLQIQTEEQAGAKVVTMKPQKSPRFTWVKYALAACVVGILGFGLWSILNTSKEETSSSKIVAGTGMTYEQIMKINVEQGMQQISADESRNYLCATGVIACNEKEEEDLQKQMSELSDEALNEFFEAQN